MSIANYLTALDAQRDQLARNLVTMGVQASESEKLNTLVPKVLQIPSGRLEVTLFHSGSDALQTYGELVYTYYVDGYRSIAGFADVYPHFCCAENDYALYYNQPDFNWGAVIYTMCITPVRITPASRILLVRSLIGRSAVSAHLRSHICSKNKVFRHERAALGQHQQLRVFSRTRNTMVQQCFRRPTPTAALSDIAITVKPTATLFPGIMKLLSARKSSIKCRRS